MSFNCTSVLVTSLDNIFYTVGFSTPARRYGQIGYTAALLTSKRSLFFVPANWKEVAQKQVKPWVEVVPYNGSIEQLAKEIAGAISGAVAVGFELDGIDTHLYLTLQKAAENIRWVNISDKFRVLRLVKSPEEICCIRKSAELASRTMEHAKKIIREGTTEWDIMAELEYYMRRNGSSGTPFTMKVLAGENAVKTINLPYRNVIKRGQIVLIDMGATLDGYASDWTRSFAVGEANVKQTELYELVWRIERECIGAIKPGVTYSQLMDIARSVVRGHEYEKYFNPFLGHSLGINSQEWPNNDTKNELLLLDGMVITIEPGVYVPGVGGVRIEDEVLVTDSGHEILTGLEKEEFVLRDK